MYMQAGWKYPQGINYDIVSVTSINIIPAVVTPETVS